MADGIGGRPLLEARVRLRADGSQLGPEAVSETRKAASQAADAASRELARGFREGGATGARQAAQELKRAGQGAALEGARAGKAFGDGFTKDARAQIRGKDVLRESTRAEGSAAAAAGAQAGLAYGRAFIVDAQGVVTAGRAAITGSAGTVGASAAAAAAGAGAGAVYGNAYVGAAQDQLKQAAARILPGGSEAAAAATSAAAGATSGTAYGAGFSTSAQRAITSGKLIQGEVISSVDEPAVAAGTRFGTRFGAKAGSRAQEELKSQLTGIGKTIIAAVAIDKAFQVTKESIAVASDLNEVGSALNVTFGEQGAASIDRWSTTTAKGFGLARLEAENANASFGIFAKSAGLTGQAAVDFSTKLTGLAGDLTSFYNPAGGTAQSIEAIGAALRGESEPIRQFGVLLDDATLRQEAFKLGIVKTTGTALTPQQRVLAAYSQILKQTSSAQGDFARTSDSTANVQRTLNNEWKDAEASIGGALLPAYRGIVTGLKDVLAEYNKIPTDGLIGKFKAGTLLSPAALAESIGLNKLFGDNLKRARESSAKVAEATATAADKAAAANARAALATLRFADAQEATGRAATASARAYGENTDKLEAMGLAGDRVAAVAVDTGHEFDRVNPKVQALGVAYERASDRAAALAGGVGKVTVSMGEQSGPAARAADGSAKLYRLYDGTAAKAAAFKEAQEGLNGALEKSPFLELRDASRAYQEALDAATEAAKKNGASLDENTPKGRDNEAALDDLARSALTYLDAINAQKGPGREFQTALAQQRADLIRAGVRFGLTKKQAEQYADKVLEIPRNVVTQVNLAGISAVNYSLDTLLNRVNALDGRRIQIYSSAANVREDRRPGKSTGGPVPGAPSEVDSRPYMLAPGEFVVRSRYASTPRNRALLEAMNSGQDVTAGLAGGAVSGGGGSVDPAAIAAAVAQGVRAAMASLPPGQVLLDGAAVGRLLRSGGGLAGIDAGGW